MVCCSAPGKVILFGEHAVVYGKPAIALSVNKRISSIMSWGDKKTTINHMELDEEKQPFLVRAIEKTNIKKPLSVTTESDLPSGAGMGSSAALTVSLLGSLHALKEEDTENETIAEEAFDVEYDVQGSASPIDTSTSVHGRAIFISDREEKNLLWSISKGDKLWNIHHMDLPDMKLVIGHTGIHAPTGPLVKMVGEFYNANNFAKEVIDEIGMVVLKGKKALNNGDLEEVGRLMNKNHKLLRILGVSHPRLESLVRATRKHSYGSKLTGAGGGGAMISLTDKPEKVADIIEKRGGEPYTFKPSKHGMRLEEKG
ncbi:MAG: mevalonate kinase [Thermoplasmata archaeon]